MKPWMAMLAVLMCMGCSCDGKRDAGKGSVKTESAGKRSAADSGRAGGNQGQSHKEAAEKSPENKTPSGSGDIREGAIPGYKSGGK